MTKVFLFVVAFLALSQTCYAAGVGLQIPSPACLAPMDPASPNPQPRDVHYAVSVDASTNKMTVAAEACLVSNLPRIADSYVSFGVFAPSGAFITIGGQHVGPLSPTAGSTSPQPRIVAAASADIGLPTGYTGSILPVALVEVQWWACKDPTSATCDAGDMHTDTFLRDVVLTTVARARHH